VLNAVAPLMRALAEKMRINVGLAAPDRDEMVSLYLSNSSNFIARSAAKHLDQ